jgi:hypothetical protein
MNEFVKLNGFDGLYEKIGVELGWPGNESGIGIIVKNVETGEELTVDDQTMIQH